MSVHDRANAANEALCPTGLSGLVRKLSAAKGVAINSPYVTPVPRRCGATAADFDKMTDIHERKTSVANLITVWAHAAVKGNGVHDDAFGESRNSNANRSCSSHTTRCASANANSERAAHARHAARAVSAARRWRTAGVTTGLPMIKLSQHRQERSQSRTS